MIILLFILLFLLITALFLTLKVRKNCTNQLEILRKCEKSSTELRIKLLEIIVENNGGLR